MLMKNFLEIGTQIETHKQIDNNLMGQKSRFCARHLLITTKGFLKLGCQTVIQKNPFVQIFTRIRWSLLKDPLFVVTALGSAYSFNALINFYLLLPLHADLYNCTIDEKVRLKITLIDQQGDVSILYFYYLQATFLSIVSGVDLFTRFETSIDSSLLS